MALLCAEIAQGRPGCRGGRCMKSRRIAISRVRQAWLGATAAAVLSLPLGLATLAATDSPDQAAVRSRSTPTPLPAKPAVVRLDPPGQRTPDRNAALTSGEADASRSVVGRLRTLANAELMHAATTGSDLVRAAAVHLLWLRGAREDVEALVASANDRVLAAKLAALRGRGE